MKTTLLCLVGLALGGCAVASGNDADGAQSGSEAIVSQPTFDKAAATVKAIDYLPFDFASDGCYARAFYMSMELASTSTESNAVFAFAKDGERAPGFGDVVWTYHTAPLLQVQAGADVKNYVIDPAVGAKPFLLDDWLSTIHVSRSTAEVVLMKGAVIDSSKAQQLTAPMTDGMVEQTLTASFADQPAFAYADIESACETIYAYDYLDAHNVDAIGVPIAGRPKSVTDAQAAAAAAPKRQKLLARTQQLVRQLESLGKTSGDPAAFDGGKCAAQSDPGIDALNN